MAASVAVLAGGAARGQAELLPAEHAFRLRARRADARTIELMWSAAPGTYLYRDRLAVATDNPQVTVTRVEMPPARTKHDRVFEREVAYYEGSVLLRVVYSGPAVPFKLLVSAQGCAEVGICYPPVTHELPVRGIAA